MCQTLCNVLEVDVINMSSCEAGKLSRIIQRERERKIREIECGEDGRIVTNQAELVETLFDENI